MKIEVRLFGFLLRYSPHKREVLELDLGAGSTLEDLAASLHIPTSEPRMNLVNGSHAGDNCVLNDGDSVVLLTPVEGG